MRIIESLISRFRRKEQRVVLARDLTTYMINDRIIPVQKYKGNRQYIKSRRETQRDVSKYFER